MKTPVRKNISDPSDELPPWTSLYIPSSDPEEAEQEEHLLSHPQVSEVDTGSSHGKAATSTSSTQKEMLRLSSSAASSSRLSLKPPKATARKSTGAFRLASTELRRRNVASNATPGTPERARDYSNANAHLPSQTRTHSQEIGKELPYEHDHSARSPSKSVQRRTSPSNRTVPNGSYDKRKARLPRSVAQDTQASLPSPQYNSLADAYSAASHQNAREVDELRASGYASRRSRSGSGEPRSTHEDVSDQPRTESSLPQRFGPPQRRRRDNALADTGRAWYEASHSTAREITGSAQEVAAQEEEEASDEPEKLSKSSSPALGPSRRSSQATSLSTPRPGPASIAQKRRRQSSSSQSQASNKRLKSSSQSMPSRSLADVLNENHAQSIRRLAARGSAPEPLRRLQSTRQKEVFIIRSSSSPDPLASPADPDVLLVTPFKRLDQDSARDNTPINALFDDGLTADHDSLLLEPPPSAIVNLPDATAAAAVSDIEIPSVHQQTGTRESPSSSNSIHTDTLSVAPPPSSRSSPPPIDINDDTLTKAPVRPAPADASVSESEQELSDVNPYAMIPIVLTINSGNSERIALKDRPDLQAAARAKTNKQILLTWNRYLDGGLGSSAVGTGSYVSSHAGMEKWQSILEDTYGPGPIDRGWRKPKVLTKRDMLRDANSLEDLALDSEPRTSVSSTPAVRSRAASTSQAVHPTLDSVSVDRAFEWTIKLNRLIKGKGTTLPTMPVFDAALSLVESVSDAISEHTLVESGLAKAIDALGKMPQHDLPGDEKKMRRRAKDLTAKWNAKFSARVDQVSGLSYTTQ